MFAMEVVGAEKKKIVSRLFENLWRVKKRKNARQQFSFEFHELKI